MADGENRLIAWLAGRFPADGRRVVIGIGDDMAAVRLDGSPERQDSTGTEPGPPPSARSGPLVAVTADMLLDGVHFDTREHTWEQIGHKAVACSLSDCAAMACRPRGAVVSLALPGSLAMDDVQRLYEGMDKVAAAFDCPIVGGDTTSWDGPLAIDVAILAEPAAPRGPVRRSGARPGDTICVSGPLGGSILGRHLRFTPRLELACRLAAEPTLHAMMDISDGLALDLHRLCLASDCGAELDADALEAVISDDARRLAADDGRPPLEHALQDGEDFELVVVAGPGLDASAFGLTRVGCIVAKPADDALPVAVRHADGRCEPLEPRGYEHWR